MKIVKLSIVSAGIDTSKAKLDICVHGGTVFMVANNETGWKQAAAQLGEAGVVRIGIEATGGYERGVTWSLRQSGFMVVVMQPLQIKAFAQFLLKRAKNDRIDAVLIAACTHVLDVVNKFPSDVRFEALETI